MKKVILHVDMDAFFAAVEQRDNPALRGKPVIVGAPPDRRGVVSAASYEARAFGVHSAMPSRQAARLCPHGVFLPVDGKRYAQASRQVFRIFERFTPLIEPLSIDEAFLDVTGVKRLFGDGPAIARRIKQEIKTETGLTASVGVAGNMFLAKLCSDLEKPDGLVVAPETEEAVAAFLAPMPVGRIWGVGKVTQQTLEQAGITTIRELQAATPRRLAALVGRHYAEHLARLARGRDARDVSLDREEKSISREYTFDKDCASAERIETVLCDLVEDVGRRLREAGKYAGLARLKLRWAGFETITRQRPLAPPRCDDYSLRRAGLELFRAEELRKPVRLIGFGVGELAAGPAAQLSLFGEDRAMQRHEQLSRTVDALRERYGNDAVRRARRCGSMENAE